MRGITDPGPVPASLRDKRLPQVSDERHIGLHTVGRYSAGGKPCRKMEGRLSRSSGMDVRGGVEGRSRRFERLLAVVLGLERICIDTNRQSMRVCAAIVACSAPSRDLYRAGFVRSNGIAVRGCRNLPLQEFVIDRRAEHVQPAHRTAERHDAVALSPGERDVEQTRSLPVFSVLGPADDVELTESLLQWPIVLQHTRKVAQ